MVDDFPGLAKDLTQYLAKLHKNIPETMTGFQSMMTGATKDGALDKKAKELIALGIAIATHCEGCIAFHVQKLVQLDVKEAEVMETLAMAVYMGGGPSLMYAAKALQAYEQFHQ